MANNVAYLTKAYNIPPWHWHCNKDPFVKLVFQIAHL
jgi:hypothetical protein